LLHPPFPPTCMDKSLREIYNLHPGLLSSIRPPFDRNTGQVLSTPLPFIVKRIVKSLVPKLYNPPSSGIKAVLLLAKLPLYTGEVLENGIEPVFGIAIGLLLNFGL